MVPGEASAAQVFPVTGSLVPVAVAAAFVLPALVAGVLSLLRSAALRLGPTMGIVLLCTVGVAVAALLFPDLVAALRV